MGGMKKIEQIQGVIEAKLHQNLDLLDIAPQLKEAISYSLFPGGKRLRPVLSMLFYSECSGETGEAFADSAASVELIHCGSLVHDDLPALDNDDMRRGKASCHKAFGESTAVLTGDALIPLAALFVLQSNMQIDTKTRIAELVMAACLEICSGQQLDMLPDDQQPSLQKIANHKTAALFDVTLRIASIAAGLSAEHGTASGQAGRQLGLCFQMLDDYIDVYGTDADRGREGSSDQRKSKRTFFAGMPEDEGKADWLRALKRLQGLLDQIEVYGPEIPLTRAFISQMLSRVEVV